MSDHFKGDWTEWAIALILAVLILVALLEVAC